MFVLDFLMLMGWLKCKIKIKLKWYKFKLNEIKLIEIKLSNMKLKIEMKWIIKWKKFN